MYYNWAYTTSSFSSSFLLEKQSKRENKWDYNGGTKGVVILMIKILNLSLTYAQKS